MPYFLDLPDKKRNIDFALRCYFDKETYGQVCQMAAVRIGESFNRRRAIMISGDFMSVRGDQYFAKPVYDWKGDDVWNWIKLRELDYSRFYDKLAKCGIPYKVARIAPWGNPHSAKVARLWAELYPEEWEQAIVRLPEIRAQARYGDTKLYLRAREKPLGMTWQEWCFKLIEDLEDEASKKFWSNYINDACARWDRTHSMPLPEHEPPVQGYPGEIVLSWNRIARAIGKNDRVGSSSRDML